MKRVAGLSSDERALMMAREERMKFKNTYREWKLFYERKVLKVNELVVPFELLKIKKDTTKPEPFYFRLDHRRGTSC